jgi:Condensation domain
VEDSRHLADSRHLPVRYSGASAGDGPLTLAQDNMVRCVLHDDPAHLNKAAVWPAPPDTTVEAAIGALRELTVRHESLRTVFPRDPVSGERFQRVLAEGGFEVEVVETDQDPDEAVMRYGRRNTLRRFEIEAEYPLRLVLVAVGGVVVRVSVVVSHPAADGVATTLLFRDWYALASGAAPAPPTSLTPRDVAEQERSAGGLRRAKASLRHWDKLLARGPHAVFAESGLDTCSGLLPTLIVRSGSAAAHLDAAANRTKTTPSVVLFAALAALVALRAGERTLVVTAASANRHRPGLEEHVGTLAQDALVSLDTGAQDFDELIARAASATMVGYWHSTFDAEKIWDVIERAADLRGARFARHVVINDLSATVPEEATRDRPAPVEDPQFTWLPEAIMPARLVVNIWRVRDCLDFTILADPQLFTREQVEQLARGLQRVLERAATGTFPLDGLGELTGIAPARREGRWERIANSWIDLAAVRSLLAVALEKRPVRIEVRDGLLVAEIADEDRPISPREAHSAVMEALGTQRTPHMYEGTDDSLNSAIIGALTGWEAALAPHRYVIRSGTPLPAEDEAAWEALAVTGDGDGRAAGGETIAVP